MHETEISADNTRRWPLAIAAAYLAFVVYGSLVPWDFRPMPFADAWSAFADIRLLRLGLGSRADWVANILLFIPLAFFWLGALWPARAGPARIGAALLVWTACLGLSVAIEFIQQFFPPRTVSLNDIIAEGLGAAIGALAWRWKGAALIDWHRRWRAVRGRASTAERLAWTYLALLFAYNLLPLDLTISPVELYHKWREGKIILLPFAHPGASGAERLYDLATDMLIWLPVGLLWTLSGRQGRLEAWARTVLYAIGLEAAQLLVYSRVTDTTDILTAMAGAALGVWCAGLFPAPAAAGRAVRGAALQAAGLAGFAVWAAVLAALFWYPFDFLIERAFLARRFELLTEVPFYHYYYGTELRAATEVLHKILFFAPLGVLLAMTRIPLRDAPLGRLIDAAAFVPPALVAALIELGQVALPGKYPDSTDWLLETLGGVLGYFGFRFIDARLGLLPPRAAARTPAAPGMEK